MMRSLEKPECMKRLPISPVEIIKGIFVAAFLAFFFYRSIWALFPMGVPAAVFIWWERKKAAKDSDKRLLKQFCECILSVGSSVKAGYAAENAFVASMKDMEMMYGEKAEILEALRLIKGGLANHLPLEKLLQEMGQRTGLKEIQEFGEIFAITKRNGGSLADVINMTAQDINSRTAVEEEINTLLASKRLEQKIMNLMPFLLVSYLQMTTPGYFDIFFQDFTGVAIMTVFLLWYIAAYGLSEYILWKISA